MLGLEQNLSPYRGSAPPVTSAKYPGRNRTCVPRGKSPLLSQLFVTEAQTNDGESNPRLPPSSRWRSDQLSYVCGVGHQRIELCTASVSTGTIDQMDRTP